VGGAGAGVGESGEAGATVGGGPGREKKGLGIGD